MHGSGCRAAREDSSRVQLMREDDSCAQEVCGWCANRQTEVQHSCAGESVGVGSLGCCWRRAAWWYLAFAGVLPQIKAAVGMREWAVAGKLQ